MKAGLRIDVDTLRGTRDGVPGLCRMLRQYDVTASFFFSVGPDNMGRHVWRLLHPAFLSKMLRSNAPNLYGWDILLKGTLWPGPHIARRTAHVIGAAAAAGHEVGLHAWDHHAWQRRIASMDGPAVREGLQRGVNALTEVLGAPPTCSAAPAWRCNDIVLTEKRAFPFRYNSDCRGHSIFRPVVDGTPLDQVQVPTTLPTYDEVIGQNGVTDDTYNEHILSLLNPGGLNVLTIHAEVEGIARADLFDRFLGLAVAKGVQFAPLGALAAEARETPACKLAPATVPGRDGWVACQTSAGG